MESILKPLKEDLLSLYNNDFVELARLLNQNFKKEFIKDFISDKSQPMYFTGKFDAKTIFIMLNPGGDAKECYSFIKCEKDQYKNFNDFFENYLYRHINYGFKDKDRMDNFDLKQAAFLYYFKDSGIDIPDFIRDSNNSVKLKAKENVLMQKLQLELIPYQSKEFKGLFDNPKLSMKNIDFFTPNIKRLFDTLVCYERKYVIFGAKQFYNLFQAYSRKGYGKIEFGDIKYCKIDNLQKRVSCSILKINHNNKQIKACIAHSFPRRDLPNAFGKMSEYGAFCFNELLK